MTHTSTRTEEEIVRDIEHRNAVECYKAELIELIGVGMFYTARGTLAKCIKEVSDYRTELCR